MLKTNINPVTKAAEQFAPASVERRPSFLVDVKQELTSCGSVAEITPEQILHLGPADAAQLKSCAIKHPMGGEPILDLSPWSEFSHDPRRESLHDCKQRAMGCEDSEGSSPVSSCDESHVVPPPSPLR